MSTPREQAKPPTRGITGPPLVEADGDLWLVCAIGGWECGRVNTIVLGGATAADVMSVHYLLHHRAWR